MKSNRQAEQPSEEKNRDGLNQQDEMKDALAGTEDTDKPEAAANEEIPETDSENITELLREKEAALAELADKYMRLAAEYDNFRRRSQKEKEALFGEAVAEVIKVWLPVIDNLDRAEFAAEKYESEEAGKLAAGISMIQKQVDEVLEKLGVEEIDCCDKPFDPELHDAVMHIEDENHGPSTVVEVLRKGYRRQDRIIRHVMVKVAN